jgi:hypothetical protein
MDHAQDATGRAIAAGPIGRAVVGEDAAHADAVGPKPAQGAPQKASGGRLAFVREQVHLRHARMIVDGEGQVFPSGAGELVEALPRHAVPQTANPAQLLGIEVQQIAHCRVLVALHDGGGVRRPRRESPHRRSTRATVAALTSSAVAICPQVHCCRRSTFAASGRRAAVSRGLEWGRLDRSSSPVRVGRQPPTSQRRPG